MIGIADRFEALLRRPWVASVVLAVAPLPVTVAPAVTARPDYPEDARYYGAPQSSIDATDHYVGLMTPPALFAMPILLGVAGLLAQPACYAGDPPAAIPR